MTQNEDLMVEHSHKHCHAGPASRTKPWYQTPLFYVTVLTGLLFFVSGYIPVLFHFRHTFLEYVRMLGFPLLIGAFVGGLLDYYVPQAYISKHLAERRKRTVLYAVGLGFFMSACSHGILALSMELHKKGAAGSAVIAFLLASPWASLPVTFLLIGFFGLKAFWLIGGALLIAILTGFIFQLLEHWHWVEHNPHTVAIEPGFSVRADIRQRLRHFSWSKENLGQAARGIAHGMRMLVDMVLLWVLVGMVLGALASAVVPPHVFDRFFGPTLLGLGMTMVAATILEVCSEGTAPLAFELYRQTGAFGNAFVFLMGGVVTDFTEIALVATYLGKRTAIWMLIIALPQVLVLGWFLNHLA